MMVMLRSAPPREPSAAIRGVLLCRLGCKKTLSHIYHGRASGIASLAGPQTSHRLDLLAPDMYKDPRTMAKKKDQAGIEPLTEGSKAGCSTAELRRHHGSHSRIGERKVLHRSIRRQKKIIRP